MLLLKRQNQYSKGGEFNNFWPASQSLSGIQSTSSPSRQKFVPNPSLWMWNMPDLRFSDYSALTAQSTKTLEESYIKRQNQIKESGYKSNIYYDNF